jgi:hypothetical protein
VILGINPRQELKGNGAGGSYCEFDVIEHGTVGFLLARLSMLIFLVFLSDGKVSFRSIVFPKAHVGIRHDGTSKPPLETGLGDHGTIAASKHLQ